ncbi:hypothetical protein KFK09_005595 [Dendrobium nobile]|uniref:Retrovirus-related Pol polyprotein from transposon TNT 1-94 n=1 Tax=Dendrobium nobile TaxID=94219 RepID=A0A8T3BYT6_DENNO|nr:hypothetical protein KFK09_005595 [Dendrobium nobile]
MVSEPMGDQEPAENLPSSSSFSDQTTASSVTSHIPQPLKFLVSNIKNLAPHPLTTDNYSIWRVQLLQQFTANGYAGHLTGAVPAPSDTASAAYAHWLLVDSNLLSALFSTVSQSILPYIITASSAHEAWTVLERRLQPISRSRVIQLKNELYRVQMKDQPMQQYLTHIKTIVDGISVSGSKIDPEDIMLHILNGLPPTFNSFKSTIRNSLLPIDLDTFYALLCNEEIHLQQESLQDQTSQSHPTALYAASLSNQRNHNYNKRYPKSKNQQIPPPSPSTQPNSSTVRPTCQICGKTGHVALNCWHRCNFKYAPTDTRQPRALLATPTTTASQDWVLDTGASAHLTPDANQLYYPTSYNGSDTVSTANGSSVPIHHTGQGLLPLPDSSRKLLLHKLLHVPLITHNLLSVSKLTSENNISITFDANGFTMKDLRDQQPLLRGQLRNGLYSIRLSSDDRHTALSSTVSPTINWHSRLGHPNKSTLSVLAKHFSDITPVSDSFLCDSCNQAKSHKLVFNKSISSSIAPFDLIHTDVWGPVMHPSLDGFRYYVIFVDDYTRFSWIYFLYTKQETLSKFKILCNLIRTQFRTTPRTLRSDGGGEFTSQAFRSFLQDNGITQQLSCPHTPEQNGIAERKHRHLLDITRALLHESGLPHKFWADATSTANYLINQLPSKAIANQIPYQRLHGLLPTYNHLRTFGCLCYPWLRPYAPDKLSPRSHACAFIGYSVLHKGYKCYDVSSGKTYISRHVVFHEKQFPYKTTAQPTSLDISTAPANIPPSLLIPPSTISQPITHAVPPQNNHCPNTPITPSHSSLHMSDIPYNTSSHTNPSPQTIPPLPPPHPMITRLKSGISKPRKIFNLLTHTSTPDTPSSYTQALKVPHWKNAMAAEIEALRHQATWSLVQPPPNKPVLGCKWTFKTKLLPTGQVDRYKARLVELGNHQQFGINYTETFSPVAKMPTIRLLLTLALHRQWPMHQLDVSNAFLHGDLPDDIYMRQPPGFVDPTNPTAVCKLHKSLYGLKQAPRQWFQKLTTFLQSQGFSFSRSDPSLLILHTGQLQVYILIYVDDFLVTGNDPIAIQTLLHQLQTQFALKQLGQISLFLGIQVIQSSTGYFLSQEHYATKLLNDAGFKDCKPAPTPITPKSNPTPALSPPFSDPSLYRRLAGSLQYLSITRPDIAYATNRVCQHMQQPTEQNFKDLKRLLRYINGTLSFGLPISIGNLELHSYSDADWASDTTDRKSISGFCTFLGPNLISWTVKKQATVAKSSTEAEYRSLSAAASDVLWLRRLALELQLPQPAPTVIHCDNTSAIAIAKNPVFHARTKHIEIDYHFIRQQISSGDIRLAHISSKDQVADIFTKPFSIARFTDLRSKLTIRSTND